jgi:MATE family multidrug resistance protein
MNLNKKINSEIFRLAIPNVLSNISVPLLSSVDTYLMGQLSAAHVAGVGLGAMIFNFLYWNMGFLRMSSTGLTAQHYGEGNEAGKMDVLLKGLFLSLTIGILFILIQIPLFNGSVFALDVQSEHLTAVGDYFSIRIWAAPPALILTVIMGWFLGLQNAIYPLLITIVVNLLNILISYYLVLTLGWGLEGAAYGTVLAQYLGLIFAIGLMYYKYKDLLFRHLSLVRKLYSGMTKLLKLNQDILIRTLFLSSAFVLLYRFSSELQPEFLAVNIIFLQYLNWMSYGIDGFAFAAESLVGKYAGARDTRGVDKAINWNMFWGGGLALIFSLVYYFGGSNLFVFFIESDAEKYLPIAQPYIIWMAIMPIAGFACYIWDGIFVGLTASKAMRNSMFLSFAIFLLIYFLLPRELLNHRIWLSFCIFLISRALFQWWLFKRAGWESLE